MSKRWLVLLAILCAVCLTAATYDRHVLLINKSSRSIVAFYASNEDSDSWEENILSDRYLSPGYQIRVNVDDGTGHCVYDFKAVLRGGATAIGRSINVCQVSSWTVTD
jgi:hypothetical protein